MAYRQEPGRGPTATFKNVTALLGPTAEVCGPRGVDKNTGFKSNMSPDGGDTSDCPTFKTKKKKGGNDSSTKKDPKSRGTIETVKEKVTKQIPGSQVSVNQITPYGETGRIENQGKSVSDFKQEVTEAGKNVGVKNVGIADRAAKFIKTPKEVVTDQYTTKTRRTNKGKTKIKVKTTQAAGKNEGTLQSTPYDMTFRKNRLIGKDKVRKYTTGLSGYNAEGKLKVDKSRAKNPFGSKSQVKLVSQDKMRKLVEKAEKKLQRGNPISISKKPTNKKEISAGSVRSVKGRRLG